MTTLLWAILVFGLIIFAHELGHFLAAKAVGIRVTEFSVGMGPLLLSAQRGGTRYSLRLLPIGGYNKIAGMEPGEEDDPLGFNRRPLRHRLAVVAAGSLMNFLLAIVIFIGLFGVLGVPSDEPVVGRVLAGRPAQLAGIEPGDRILSVGGQEVRNWTEMVGLIHKREGQPTVVEVGRGANRLKFQVVPVLEPEAKVGIIGIEQSWRRLGILSSVALGLQQAWEVSVLILRSLVEMLARRAPAEVAGPVGIVKMVGQAARYGLANVLSFAGLLSLDLGLINLFPIPALDGGRLVFLGVEGVRGKPIDPHKENLVHLIGYALLMALILVITYKDLLKIFG